MVFAFLLYSSIVALLGSATAKQVKCSPKSIAEPAYFGVKVTSFDAVEVKNYNESSPLADMYHLPPLTDPVDFCNVTIIYTHPGTDDSVFVNVWLPLDNWNGRFLAQGGGGFAGGFEGTLIAGVANGFAAALTDTGHDRFTMTLSNWALKSKGVVDLQAVSNFGSIALDDMTHLGKSVTESFYGKKIDYSYFIGCSGGGRQGLIHAQRFPQNYDGIIANAPGLAWSEFGVTMNMGMTLIQAEDYVPPPCELSAIYQAVIDACDELDGVKDGIISAADKCKFNAKTVVGTSACGGKLKVSKHAANIVNAIWAGIKTQGGEIATSHGVTMPFSSEDEAQGHDGLLQTHCDGNHKNCEPVPFMTVDETVKYLIARDPDMDWHLIKPQDLAKLLRISQQQYASTLDADWADLSEFKAAGGKMITWHGIADQLLHYNMTQRYYKKVLAADPQAADYYRYFEAPGVKHCAGGPGFYPTDVWQALQKWVEQGEAPGQLTGMTVGPDKKVDMSRPLCPYPLVARYVGGDAKDIKSYKCAEDFGTKKAEVKVDEEEHEEL